jgi:hypothetical protein
MIFKNEYTTNFILIPILVILFLPVILIESLNDFFIIYTLIISIVYPIYLTIGNIYIFKSKKPRAFLRKFYLMAFATIINLTVGIPLSIKVLNITGSQILMVFVLIFLALLITLIGGLFVYLSLGWIEKDRINLSE